VEVLTDRPEERFAPGRVLHPEAGDRSLTIAESSAVADGPGWWLTFTEIGSRDAAESLRDAYLEAEIDPDELPAGEVYWHEVVGVPVVGLDGREVGTVEGIYRVGVAEVLEVRGPLGALDIPNVSAIVREFAPRDGRIVVDVGALDLDEGRPPKRPRGRRTRRAAAAGPGEGTGAEPDRP
jgi:16S rRNA processing protein RimM